MSFNKKSRAIKRIFSSWEYDDIMEQLYCCKKRLRNNKSFVMYIVETYYFGQFVHYISNRLRNDKEVIMKCIKYYNDSYCDMMYAISDKLRNDKEVVLAIVRKDPDQLQYALDIMKDDKEVILAAIGAKQYLDAIDNVIYYGSDGIYLEYASARLKNDKELVLKAVESNGWAFQFASEELRDDKELLLKALNSQHYSYVDVSGVIEYASERLKQDIEIRKLLESRKKI